MKHFVHLPPVKPGDKVAVLSPAWGAPSYFPHIHQQAMARLAELLQIEVVEYPTTRAMGASPQERAHDLNAAFADPAIRAIITTIGGDDQIRLLEFLDAEAALSNPKPFFGYSDNTNILNWLWRLGIPSFHGGATMVHLGAGPVVDSEHLRTLRAALCARGDIELVVPADSEDYGLDWSDPRVLTEAAAREDAIPLEFYGNPAEVRGRTWGGCLEVLDQLAWAGKLPEADELAGMILILETSELLPAPDLVGRWIRGMGERGYLHSVAGMIIARPVVDDRDHPAPDPVRAMRRNAQRDYIRSELARYREDLPVCFGVPFGHTRPQYILPYGSEMTLSVQATRVIAHFGSEDNRVR